MSALGTKAVLKISIVDSPRGRRLVVEGALIAPWAAELKKACTKARVDLDGSELVIDLKNLIAISLEGESILLALMNEGIKVRCHGIYTRLVLRKIARARNRN